MTLPDGRRADEDLFGESGERILVTCRPEALAALREIAGDVPVSVIGAVGGDTVEVSVDGANIRLELERARDVYETTLTKAIA